jgi:electron transport complex protein RnfD
MSLLTPTSPHQHGSNSIQALMLRVLLALVPGIAVYAWFINQGVLVQILLAIITAVLAESLVLKLRRRPVINTVSDGSAILTAVLLALALPPLAPWWLIVLGSAFAIIFGKQLYGGIGYNPFNPAMLGYAMLLIAFPLEMTSWQLLSLDLGEAFNMILFGNDLAADAISGATPLDTLKTRIGLGESIEAVRSNPDFATLYGTLAGKHWEWVSLAFLVGGGWLLWRRDIAWQIPLAMILAIVLLSGVFWLIEPARHASPLFHVFGGATLLGAFFIATDPISASTTPRGRLIYGAGIGIIVWLIRGYGGYPDGVAFAVLLMNMAAPTIDHFTQPRVFGERGNQ